MWSLFCSVRVYISLYFLPLNLCNFPLSLLYKSPFFIKFITQSYLSLLIFFLFLSAFSVLVNDYFLRCLACKSLLSRFSVIINYIMQSYNLFSVSSCFPNASGLRFFSTQVFQGPTPRSVSML